MDINIEIDTESGIPVYIQLEEQIRVLIRSGSLGAGDPMPTTRSFAVQLGINVNTVARVYRDLQVSGHLRLKQGVGTFVADGVDRPVAKKDVVRLSQQADMLIQISREIGISCTELTRFITTKWKENDHV